MKISVFMMFSFRAVICLFYSVLISCSGLGFVYVPIWLSAVRVPSNMPTQSCRSVTEECFIRLIELKTVCQLPRKTTVQLHLLFWTAVCGQLWTSSSERTHRISFHLKGHCFWRSFIGPSRQSLINSSLPIIYHNKDAKLNQFNCIKVIHNNVFNAIINELLVY